MTPLLIASHGDLSQGLAGLSHCAPAPHKGTMGCRLLGLGSALQSGKNVGSKVFQAQRGCRPAVSIKGQQIASNCWRRFHVRARLEEGLHVGGQLAPPSGNGALESILGSAAPQGFTEASAAMRRL